MLEPKLGTGGGAAELNRWCLWCGACRGRGIRSLRQRDDSRGWDGCRVLMWLLLVLSAGAEGDPGSLDTSTTVGPSRTLRRGGGLSGSTGAAIRVTALIGDRAP